VAAHGFVFAVAPVPFAVFVAFVGGDVDDGADAGSVAHGFQEVNGAHDVGGVGLDRAAIGLAHQGLGGHVDDDVRLGLLQGGPQGEQIADVGDVAGDALPYPGQFEQAGPGIRRQRVPRDLGAELAQPERQPTALEAGVAGEEYFFSVKKSIR